MSNPSTETQLAILTEKQKTMDERLQSTDAAVAALIDERNKALKWGILSLGSAVMGMGYWIVNFFTGHAKW